jgi:hypothetical protein
MSKKLIFISISLVGILVLPTLSLGQTQNTTFSQLDCNQYTSQQEKLMCTYFNPPFQLYTLLIQQLQSRIGIQPGQPVQPTEPSQPVITSISPNPATIGQTITVTGRNLKGFEGDKMLIIENSFGQKGIIYDESGSTQDGIIKFTLKDTYCTSNTSYSGLPCPSYINITPGTYYIYTQPWGKISNKLEFKVISPNNQPSITLFFLQTEGKNWR